jgi:site-specific DNA recombinase
MKRAAIYTRVSRDDTGEGRSVERQLEACRKLADLRGWEVTHELCDNSISAWSGKARPAWGETLGLVEAGAVDVVVAWHIDRLTRSMLDLEKLITLAEKGGVGVATATGDIDLTTDVGRMVARILAAVARAEVERKSARQRLANAARAKRGLPHISGTRPFGYGEDHVTVVPDEADMIRSAAAAVLAGTSLNAIVREWTKAGYSSARTKREGAGAWTSTGVRTLLTNPRYAGIRVYQGEEVGEAAWEPIIDLETHLALKAKLTDPGRYAPRRSTGRGASTLLSGIIRCSTCAAPMRASSLRKRLTYSCRPGGHVHAPRELVDGWVAAAAVAFLSQSDALVQLVPSGDDEADQAREQADTLRTRLAALAESFAVGAITQDQLVTATATLRGMLEQAEATLAAHAGGVDLTGLDVGTTRVADQWEALTLPRQRAIIDRLFEVEAHQSGGARSSEFDVEKRVSVSRRELVEA